MIAPCALITGLMSPVAGKLYDKIGMKPLAMLGTALVLISEISTLFVREDMSSYILIIPLVILGFGMSFVMMNLAAFGMEKLEGAEKTDGTALMTCLRTIGGALGAAGFVSLMSVGVTDSNYTMANVRHSYVGMVILAVVCVVLAFGFIKQNKQK